MIAARGGEEAERVTALAQSLGNPERLHLHDGSYASFASHIVQSQLYVGYDSAGQHVAAAANVPLVLGIRWLRVRTDVTTLAAHHRQFTRNPHRRW